MPFLNRPEFGEQALNLAGGSRFQSVQEQDPTDNPLFKIGLTLQAIGAGLQGGENPIPKHFEGKERERRAKRQEQMQMERFKLEKLSVIPKFFEMAEKLSSAGLSDEQVDQMAAPLLSEAFNVAAGGSLGPELFSNLIKNPRRLKAAKQVFGNVPEDQLKEMLPFLTNEQLTKTMIDKAEKVSLQQTRKKIQGAIESGQIAPGMSQADLFNAIPDAADLDQDEIASFGFVTGKTAQAKQTKGGASVGVDREALAQEKGFASFAEAPQDIKAEINAKVEKKTRERAPTKLEIIERAAKGDKTAIATLNEANRASIGATMTNLIRRSMGLDVRDPEFQKISPKAAQTKLGEMGRIDLIKGLMTSGLSGLGGSEGLPEGESQVKVISPDGKRGSIPASQLDEALKAGFRRAE